MKPIILLITIVAISLMTVNVHAQTRQVSLDGKATTVRATVAAKKSETLEFSGKSFKWVTIKQSNSGVFRFELKRGKEVLSSGKTGKDIVLKSDGNAVYTLTIFNDAGKARKIELSFAQSGGDPNV